MHQGKEIVKRILWRTSISLSSSWVDVNTKLSWSSYRIFSVKVLLLHPSLLADIYFLIFQFKKKTFNPSSIFLIQEWINILLKFGFMFLSEAFQFITASKCNGQINYSFVIMWLPSFLILLSKLMILQGQIWNCIISYCK